MRIKMFTCISHNLFKKTRLKYRISHTIIGISHTIANVILIIQSSTLNKYNRQIKKFPTEKQNVSLKHILT